MNGWMDRGKDGVDERQNFQNTWSQMSAHSFWFSSGGPEQVLDVVAEWWWKFEKK